MRRKRKHLEPMCDVQGMSVTTATQRLTTKTATQRACSRVPQVFQVAAHIVGFRVVLRVDLVLRVVNGVGRLNVQQDGFIRQLHFTTQTQHQVQSSFLLDIVVRLCPVIVRSICIPNSCIFHIAKTGLLRCCLYTLRRLQQTADSCTRSICNR